MKRRDQVGHRMKAEDRERRKNWGTYAELESYFGGKFLELMGIWSLN